MLKMPPYLDPRQEEKDKQFVMKKLGFTEEKFEMYIKSPEILHQEYGSEKWLWDGLVTIVKSLRYN